MIFVDKLARYPQRPSPRAERYFGNGKRSCHLWTDGDAGELHVFAARLGLRREWYQEQHSVAHYDLMPTKRALAVQNGAHEISLLDWLRERVRP